MVIGETRQPQSAALWQARIVCLSAFGPYLVGGMRTEQAVVFTLAAWTLITGWHRFIKTPSGLLPVIILWLALMTITLIGTFWRPEEIGGYGPQPVSHGIVILAWPLALMVLVWSWSAVVPATRLALLATRITVAGMCVNTAISGAETVTRNPVIIGVLPRFWDAPGSVQTVALNAAENFRYSGIFNQPAEAGMAYALALCALVYLAQIRAVGVRATAAGIILLGAGGLLTGSKVFLLGGIPVTLLMVLQDRRSRVRVVASTACAVSVLWLVAITGIAPAWAGGVEVSRLLHPSVTTWTAGRYGSDATLGPAMVDVLRSSPWYGFGAGGLNVPYDSLWLEVLVFAGIAGFALAVLTLLFMAVRCARLGCALGGAERRLAVAALIVAVETSPGLPSLTANRASLLLWMILGPLLAAPRVCVGEFMERPYRLRGITSMWRYVK